MKQCLIVDDSVSIRRVAARILENFGMGAKTVADPQAALEVCGDAMPDCILVDWSMPEFDPVRFMASVRRLPGGERAVIMPCLCENDEVRIRKAWGDGAVGRLFKPFDVTAMRDSLTAVGVI